MHASNPPAVWQSTRYRVERALARGGMGVVYQAFDRLGRRRVAVKRVEPEGEHEAGASASSSEGVDPRLVHGSAPPHLDTSSSASSGSLSLADMSEADHQRLALAREFRILASLRHPHIISVLDYGFDEQGRSYLVMELLDGTRTLREARSAYSLEQRIELLGQLMQALRYLHRTGVVHRDLKPQNVLLAEPDGQPQVKVVDFGLAVWAQHHDPGAKPAGTVAYMAPEIVLGAAPSVSTDIYALGVICYELCAGVHPYDHVGSSAEMLTAARFGMADMKALPLAAEARELIAKMMSPKPAARPRDAEEALARWCDATGLSVPSEPSAIRDSFLSAARFVGRERELARLTGALDEARAGRGASWLVSGVSGVGKSRLLDEVKAAALVRGMLVLRGQALDAGGRSFALWRDILREVALYVRLSPLEASVLKELVGDLDRLLERPVAPAPPLERDGNLRRLARVVEAVFDRLQVPVLVLLEDLHWAGPESAALLRRVALRIGGRRALVVGSLRSEERPAWLEQLQVAEELQLPAFGAEHIGDLCEAIVGDGTSSAEVVGAIRRASGGNAFFIVEQLRSLAEERGSLQEVAAELYARRSLMSPERLLERRLARVPQKAREVLELAAVVGRQIDPLMLGAVLDDVDGWLSQCAAAVVLEVVDERWRFCHDKLREQLLAGLTRSRRRALHRRAADALQQAYGVSVPAADMAYHRWEAGQEGAALPYLLDAAEESLKQGALSLAQSFARDAMRAAERLPGTLLDNARARLVLVDTHYALSELPEAAHHAYELLADAGLTVMRRTPTMLALTRELLRAARVNPLRLNASPHGDEVWRVVFKVVFVCFHVQVVRGHGEEAFYLLVLGHNLARSLGLAEHVAAFECGIAYSLGLTPLRTLGLRLAERASRVIEAHGGEDVVLLMHEGRGQQYLSMGRLPEAAHHQQLMEMVAAGIGDERKQLFGMLQGSLVAEARGDLDGAQHKLLTARRYATESDDHQLRGQSLNREGWLALHRGQAEVARVACEAGLALEPPFLVRLALLGGLALALWMAGEMEAAEDKAVELLRVSSARRLGGHAGVFALPAAAHVLLDRYRVAPDAARRRQAEGALRRVKRYASRFLVAEPAYLLLSGAYARDLGRARQARDAFTKSAAVAQRMGLVLDRAMAQIELAELPGADAGARARGRRAHQELLRRGALGCLRMVGQLSADASAA